MANFVDSDPERRRVLAGGLSIEEIASELFNTTDKHKTPDCIETDTLAAYVDRTLPSSEWGKVETHVLSCLYCIDQLVELRELLFLEKTAEPLPRSFQRRLLRSVMGGQIALGYSLFEKFRDFLKSTLQMGRLVANSKYTWQGAFAALLLILVFRSFLQFFTYQTKTTEQIDRGPENNTQKIASEVSESVVTVRLTSAKGDSLQPGRGLIVDPIGYVLVPLQVLSGGVSGEVTLANGSSIPIQGVKVDENNDFAVIKLDTSVKLKAANLADYSHIRTGDEILAISQGAKSPVRADKAILGEYVPSAPKGRSREIERIPLRQFIPIERVGDRIPQGVLTDRSGAVIAVSLASPKGESVGLAIPISHVKKLIWASGQTKPLGQEPFQVHPQEAVYYYVKGVLADDAGNSDAAMTYYEKCLEIDPTYDQAHLAIGYLYYQQRNYEKEIFHYQSAIKINPSNADAYSSLGAAYDDQNNYLLAIESYEQALALNPSDEETLTNLAIDHLQVGQRAKALEQYEALKKLHPGAANYLKGLIDHWR